MPLTYQEVTVVKAKKGNYTVNLDGQELQSTNSVVIFPKFVLAEGSADLFFATSPKSNKPLKRLSRKAKGLKYTKLSDSKEDLILFSIKEKEESEGAFGIASLLFS